MKRAGTLTALLLALLILISLTQATEESLLESAPPPSQVDAVVDTLHGVPIVDPYRWLEDQESPETRAWIDVQNEYTRSILDSLPGREKLRQRLSELIRFDYVSIPSQRNNRYFTYKRSAEQNQYVICMRQGIDGKDEVLVDPHTLSPDLTTSVSMKGISEDGTVLAYGIRQGGEDEQSIKLLNVDTGEEMPDQLPRAVYWNISLKPDLSGFYYSRREEQGSRIYYHNMGSRQADDEMIFGDEYGSDKSASCRLSQDGKYLIITVHYGTSGRNEIYFQNLSVQDTIKALVKGIDAHFYGLFAGELFLMETDWDAPNGRILAVDLEKPERDSWRELIPESDAALKGFSAAGRKLFVHYLRNVSSEIEIFDIDGNHLGEIAVPSLGAVSRVYGRWSNKNAFYSFSSFHIPSTIYRYDVTEGTQSVWDRLDIPVESDDFTVKQVWYISKDGTKIPMFLAHRKDLELNGSNPTLLSSYGGFRSSQRPYFSSLVVSLLENRGVFAMPNLRGGGEFGEEWHRAGMLESKQNTFDDFIAAAEWLIGNGYTSPSKLAIRGGSNGGLLVGAAMCQRPDLFKAVICTYPLLDMLRYHLFLMGEYWVSEYGSSEDPEQFKYIYAYSPYHNVIQNTEYPAVLFITGDSDTRVAPLHARKMTALLQAANGSDNPILLLYDTKAGHSGGQPVSKQIEDRTDEQSFLFWQLGVE